MVQFVMDYSDYISDNVVINNIGYIRIISKMVHKRKLKEFYQN